MAEWWTVAMNIIDFLLTPSTFKFDESTAKALITAQHNTKMAGPPRWKMTIQFGMQNGIKSMWFAASGSPFSEPQCRWLICHINEQKLMIKSHRLIFVCIDRITDVLNELWIRQPHNFPPRSHRRICVRINGLSWLITRPYSIFYQENM